MMALMQIINKETYLINIDIFLPDDKKEEKTKQVHHHKFTLEIPQSESAWFYTLVSCESEDEDLTVTCPFKYISVAFFCFLQ